MKTKLRNIMTVVLLISTVAFGGNEPEGVTFKYELGYSGSVTLKIFNNSGVLIRTLLNNQTQSTGGNSVFWDGKNNDGGFVATGTYIYEIKTVINGSTQTKTGYVQYIK